MEWRLPCGRHSRWCGLCVAAAHRRVWAAAEGRAATRAEHTLVCDHARCVRAAESSAALPPWPPRSAPRRRRRRCPVPPQHQCYPMLLLPAALATPALPHAAPARCCCNTNVTPCCSCLPPSQHQRHPYTAPASPLQLLNFAKEGWKAVPPRTGCASPVSRCGRAVGNVAK